MEIKKLKKDKKSSKNKFEELIAKEASKYLDVTVQVEEKGTNIDPDNITIQEDPNPIEVKMYSKVAVQTMEISSEDPLINQATYVCEGNQIP